MSRIIEISLIAALLIGLCYADETLLPANDQITVEYLLSATYLEVGDTLTVTRIMVNGSIDTLNNLYWLDNLPPELPVLDYGFFINGNEDECLFSGPVRDHLFAAYDSYRWVIDLPSSNDPYDHKISPSDSITLIYHIACEDTGSFILPFRTTCFNGGAQSYFTTDDSLDVAVSFSGSLGNIAGTVTDNNSNPICNAQITIIEDSLSCLTLYDGSYLLADLQPGIYSLLVTHLAYEDTSVIGIEVFPNQTTTCNIVLNAADLLYMPGDVNGDRVVIGSDITYAVNYFRGIGPPPPDSVWIESTDSWLYAAADANGSCSVIGADVTYLVAYFRMIHAEILYCPLAPPY